jgi:CBS domain-containing protein
MVYYVDAPPRHSHRTPSELAEDEIFAAMHGNVCIAPLMMEKQIHRVLIMDGDARVGIVSTSDLPRAVAEHRIGTTTSVSAQQSV